MEELIIKYPQYLDELSGIYKKSGHTLYIVGGFVRDAVLGYVSDDIDICSGMAPHEVIHMLEEEPSFSVTQTNLPMGTLIIRHKGVSLEYTAFRKESYRRDGTHTPNEVSFSATIKEDALRRDFTCNALYYNIQTGEISDFFDGKEDIRHKIIKTTRKPEDVFSEDALRILRMARLAAEIKFIPDEKTKFAAKNLADSLFSLSKERIVTEIYRILTADKKYPGADKTNVAEGMKLLFSCGAAGVLFPGTRIEKSLVCADAFSYSARAALFLYKCTALETALSYICPNSEIKSDVSFLLKNVEHDDKDSLKLLAQYGFRKGKLLDEMTRALGKKHLLLSRYLKNMEQNDYIISMKTLAVSGRDIKKALSLSDSPEIGRIKNLLLSHIIQHPEDNKREKLIQIIVTYATSAASHTSKLE